ncbi:unnamed protein product [Toxocara canis]|uniref:START domain-containing protein n=1 Tax=Toxocara canis TaxID=6265 RepID=A0A183V640_TOXCA|nr:unnamed protein product [Toxocara canis]
MPHSITVAGVTDTLEPQHEKQFDLSKSTFKYGEALKLAADAMNDVLLVLNTPEFETMEGWKKKKENKSDIVYSKRFEFGKVFTLRVRRLLPTRGNLILGGGRLRVHPKDPNKTIIDYLVCLDFNGPDLTKPVVESTLSKFILQDAEWAKEQIEKKKAEK